MTAGGPSRNRAGGPAFLRGLLCFILGLAFGSPPAAACPPQGRIGCDSARPLRFVGAHSVRPPGPDALPVSGLRTAMSSKQSPLYLGTPWRAFLARSLASPLQTAPAGLGCRLGPPAAAHSSSSLRTAINASVGSCTVPKVRIFFLPVQTGQGPFGYPGMISMLGRSEFALRQGFCLRQKRLYGAMRRPTLWGPRKANKNALLTPRPA